MSTDEVLKQHGALKDGHLDWLTTCPADDCNYDTHLKSADLETLFTAIRILTDAGGFPRPNQKGKVSKLEAEIGRRMKRKNPLEGSQ